LILIIIVKSTKTTKYIIYILSENVKKILSFASDILLGLRTIRGIKVNNRRISANHSEYL